MKSDSPTSSPEVESPAPESESAALASQPPADSDQAAPGESPLRSCATNTFAELLTSLGVSVVTSTYQAGLLVALRAEPTGAFNTHFRRFPRPMGLAAKPGVMALGTAREVVEFRNLQAVGDRLDPPGKHDACYLPRKAHITGNIDVHEMAWGNDGLCFVNTRFSCLCSLDAEHSFVPLWWPPFISSLGPEDRCHLNGLAMRDGQPRYVTAHGSHDTPAGWRDDKAHGGVLIDVASNEIISQGLSMPHSPRWHNDQLWLLESGDGSLGRVDLATGRYEAVTKFQGFTRGLSFCGPWAFVGLSQVRESASFSGIPLAERLEEKDRTCGVAAIDLRSGKQVAYVHFQDAVQEIFAVEVLPFRFPEILEASDNLVGSSYALPDEALAHVRKLPIPAQAAGDTPEAAAE